MINEDIQRLIDYVKKNYMNLFILLFLYIIGHSAMPKEESHYLKSEIELLEDYRFWLIIEISAFGVIFYEITQRSAEKFTLKKFLTKWSLYALLVWSIHFPIMEIWQFVELYYNRQEVKEYKVIQTEYRNNYFYDPDLYFSDMQIQFFFKLNDALPDTLDVEKTYKVPIKFSVGKFGWKFDPQPLNDQIELITE